MCPAYADRVTYRLLYTIFTIYTYIDKCTYTFLLYTQFYTIVNVPPDSFILLYIGEF